MNIFSQAVEPDDAPSAALPCLSCSIIINTYNRAPYLRRLLAGIGHLRDALFEVVVVNGPSTDGTEQLLEHYRGRIKIVNCRTRNLSHSRNLGIAAATGDIVVFIDDDALPGDARWLARYVEAFGTDGSGRLAAAGGPVWHADTSGFEFQGGMISDYGFQIFDNAQRADIDAGRQRWVTGVRGCNCAFRRSTLVALGGFDEFFTYYLDESDLCLVLAHAGFQITYLPDNAVRHYSARSELRTSQYDRNWHVVTRSDTYFALKHGADPLLRRLGKTLRAAPAKHYVGEINGYLRNREISLLHWLRLMRQWSSGLMSGVWAGLMQLGRPGDFSTHPEPFLPFAAAQPAQQLRIALLSQTLPGQHGYGGIGRYTFDLAQGLHERGHEVHIICKDEQPLRYHSLGFYIHGIPATGYAPGCIAGQRPVLNKNLSYSMALVRKLAQLETQGFSFDVVHASNWDCEAAALIRARIYPTVLMLVSPLAQVITTEHWQLDDDLALCISLDRWQIEHADAICVPSQGVLSTYTSLMDISPESISHLYTAPLGIVPERPQPISQPGARRRLLFVGRCERRKGAHTLLEILPDLLAAYPDWECHLVGNDQVSLTEGGTLKDRFLAQYRNASWLDRVVFHGIVPEDQLRRQYQGCDLFVAPSLFESFGLIYHEAMQYGKAVVGCRTGGVPEVVEHGVEGLLVSPDSPKELRTALAALMADGALRRRMGDAGFRRVHEAANYRTMAARMEQIYIETIANVAEHHAARRKQLWPRELRLDMPSDSLIYSGRWETQDARPGYSYRKGFPGAMLSFEASSGSTLRLVLLRHSWSGILQIRAGEGPPHYIDLYQPGEMQLAYSLDISLAGAAEEPITVTLSVHSERHPESRASEVWIKQLIILAPTDPLANEAVGLHL